MTYRILLAVIFVAVVSRSYGQPAGYSGTLQYAEKNKVDTYEPITVWDNPANDRLESLMFIHLFRVDENIKVVNELVDSVKPSKTPHSVILVLKRGVRWRNSQKDVDCLDVLFTVNLLKNPLTRKNPQYADDLSRFTIEQMNDTYTLRVTFTGDSAGWQFRMRFPILPHDKFQGTYLTRTMDYCYDPVSSGKYILQKKYPDGNVWLAANPTGFFSTPSTHSRIQTVKMFMIPEDYTRVQNLKMHTIDLLIDVPPKKISEIQGADGFKTLPYSSMSYNFLGFNFRNPIFKEPRIREAISKGIDRAGILNNHFAAEGNPVASHFPDGSPNFSGMKPDSLNVEEAKGLLAKAGCTDENHDGVMEFNGKPLRFRLVCSKEKGLEKSTVEEVATTIQGNLKKIGVDIDIDMQTPNDYDRTRDTTREFDLLYAAWQFIDIVGNDVSMFSSHDRGMCGKNYINYQSNDIDGLIDKFVRATDTETKKTLGRSLDGRLAEERPYVFLYSIKRVAAFNRDKLGGIYTINPFSFFDSIDSWYVADKWLDE